MPLVYELHRAAPPWDPAGLSSWNGREPAPRHLLLHPGFNPTIKAVYQRLREAGKPPELAFIAIARKLLVATNAIARDRTEWQT